MHSTIQPRFAVGTLVRVKIGVMDPDLPGVHLGGWKGTISQVQNGGLPTYLVQWSPETLENVHPAHRDHCQKEDIAFDKIWLLEEDLEHAYGAPSPLKRKKKVAPALLPC